MVYETDFFNFLASIRDEIKSKIWDIKKVGDIDLWIMISISLLRVEVFHRGKITFEDLQAGMGPLELPLVFKLLQM